MIVNVCPDISSEPQNLKFFFFYELGMVMQYHEPKCHTQELVHCVQCQGHNKGFYKQNMTISVVFSKLLVGWQPNLT